MFSFILVQGPIFLVTLSPPAKSVPADGNDVWTKNRAKPSIDFPGVFYLLEEMLKRPKKWGVK